MQLDLPADRLVGAEAQHLALDARDVRRSRRRDGRRTTRRTSGDQQRESQRPHAAERRQGQPPGVTS
ncbi:MULTISPECIES: hypothetical protein [unclassified Modestobacter]|uniref:hypothetical protein n=1 Tax=unclassified Modestobacter TaxID=2643866 RepID=UPI0022AACC87|nr:MULTISPECIES: hypothetical protein [unclassified Modestobacter]